MLVFAPVLGCPTWWRDCCVEVCYFSNELEQWMTDGVAMETARWLQCSVLSYSLDSFLRYCLRKPACESVSVHWCVCVLQPGVQNEHLMLSLKVTYTLLLSTQGFSKPIDEYLNCTEGAIYVARRMKQVSTINGAVYWSCCLLLANHWNAGHNAAYGNDESKIQFQL